MVRVWEFLLSALLGARYNLIYTYIFVSSCFASSEHYSAWPYPKVNRVQVCRRRRALLMEMNQIGFIPKCHYTKYQKDLEKSKSDYTLSRFLWSQKRGHGWHRFLKKESVCNGQKPCQLSNYLGNYPEKNSDVRGLPPVLELDVLL